MGGAVKQEVPEAFSTQRVRVDTSLVTEEIFSKLKRSELYCHLTWSQKVSDQETTF